VILVLFIIYCVCVIPQNIKQGVVIKGEVWEVTRR